MGLLPLRQGLGTFPCGGVFSFRGRGRKGPLFHFDFHNLPALHQTILDGEFVEPDNPDHPHFLEQARRLRSGEQDWFVGALYYPLFSPEMHFCNASVRSGVPLTQLLSPSVPPYYG